MGELYLVMDDTGQVELATQHEGEALDWVTASGQAAQWLAPDPGFGYQQNPPLSPAEALALTGLEPIPTRGEIEKIKPESAYKAVLPYFKEARRLGGGRGLGTERREVTKPLYGILTSNFKLAKVDPGKPAAVSLGLALLPEFSAFRGWTEGGVELPGWRPSRKGLTLCMGSSRACRASCLVYSGNNQSDWRNNLAKAAKTKALIQKPRAFMRLVLHALDRYAGTDARELGNKRTAVRAVRLNLYSDIPWELFVPWLFEDDRFAWYDYTKVPGRATPPSYDLSFSYSGENLHHLNAELRRGVRGVIVFAAPQYLQASAAVKRYRTKKAKETAYRTWNPLPDWIESPYLSGGRRLSVRDGDASDFRFFDPPDVIVGLRWKPPLVQGSHGEPPKKFVVMGTVVESSMGRIYVLPETPLARPSTRGKRLA